MTLEKSSNLLLSLLVLSLNNIPLKFVQYPID
jgi:hypothetical protein